MNSKNITIIETWDNKIYEIEIDIEQWLTTIEDLGNKGKKKIFLSKYKETLYFSNIKNEKGKTLYIALPEPKKEFKELTPEERIQRDKMISEMMKKTYKGRRERFLKVREETLKRLSHREESFGLETTLNKLEELNKFKKQEILKKGK